MLFDCLYGSSSPLAGTSPVRLPPECDNRPIENFDVSSLAPLHIDYNKKEVVQRILSVVKIHTTESCDDQILSVVAAASSHSDEDGESSL